MNKLYLDTHIIYFILDILLIKIKEMFKKIIVGLIALVALVFIVSLFLPREVTIERASIIKAKPEVVFAQVIDMNKWKEWDPWYKMDPNMKESAEGAPGKGHKRCWDSEKQNVGKGCLTIIDVVQNKELKTKLEFEGQGEGNGFWTFEETPEGTKVVWGMSMDMGWNPLYKMMGLMMDGMLGPMFEEGLASLGQVAEKKEEEAQKRKAEMESESNQDTENTDTSKEKEIMEMGDRDEKVEG